MSEYKHNPQSQKLDELYTELEEIAESGIKGISSSHKGKDLHAIIGGGQWNPLRSVDEILHRCFTPPTFPKLNVLGRKMGIGGTRPENIKKHEEFRAYLASLEKAPVEPQETKVKPTTKFQDFSDDFDAFNEHPFRQKEYLADLEAFNTNKLAYQNAKIKLAFKDDTYAPDKSFKKGTKMGDYEKAYCLAETCYKIETHPDYAKKPSSTHSSTASLLGSTPPATTSSASPAQTQSSAASGVPCNLEDEDGYVPINNPQGGSASSSVSSSASPIPEEESGFTNTPNTTGKP